MKICHKYQWHSKLINFIKFIKTPLLNLLINYISARSAPQIFSIKVDLHVFLIALIIGLCNCPTNSLF